MNTEHEIVYNILNTIRNAEHNIDESITERLMRGFLRVYRAESIRKYYKDGHIVNDEVFQHIPLELNKISDDEFEIKIPKIIRFQNHYGFYIQKNGITIPVNTSEEYELGNKNPFNSSLVKAKTVSDKIVLYKGKLTNCMTGGNDNVTLISLFYNELQKQKLDGVKEPKIKIDFYGVLHNPDDCPQYNWEEDSFPFPSERLDELKTQILKKEFGIMVQAKKDEVSNSRSDDISYQENFKIDGGGAQ